MSDAAFDHEFCAERSAADLSGLGPSAQKVLVRVPTVPVDVESFFVRYGPMVHRRCTHLLKNEADADDATQEVFVRVLRRAQAEGVVDDKPVSYLWTVATNVCLNRLRTRRRKPTDSYDADTALVDAIAAVDDGVSTSPLRAAVERVFFGEPESTRLMAVLHFVDGLTLEETAHELGMSVSGVRKRLRTFQEKMKLRPERHELG